MNVTEFSEYFRQLGFVDGDIPKDLGIKVVGLVYLKRNHQGQHQYVSLCSYLGVFVEAVLVVYEEPFNSRLKTQQSSLHAGLYRDRADLESAVTKIYELPKKGN